MAPRHPSGGLRVPGSPWPLAALALALTLALALPSPSGAQGPGFSCYGCSVSSCGPGYCNSCASTSPYYSCRGRSVRYACSRCASCINGICTGCAPPTCSRDDRWNAALALGLVLGIGIPAAIVVGIVIWWCLKRRREAAANTYASYQMTHLGQGGYQQGQGQAAVTGGYYAGGPAPAPAPGGGGYAPGAGVYGGPPPASAYTPAPAPAYGYPVAGYPAPQPGGGSAACPPAYGQPGAYGQPYGQPGAYGQPYGQTGAYGQQAPAATPGLGAPPAGYPGR